MDKAKKYKFIKRTAAFVVAVVTFYGAMLGIVQYYENKSGYDLSGEWTLDLKIELTSYRPYQNLEVGYKVYLDQVGLTVSGKGEKWWVDGEEIPFSQHDLIEMNGMISGESLPLSFSLRGSNRETVGIFRLKVDGGQKLVGSFSTTGADSRGSVVMTKVSRSDTGLEIDI